MKALAFSGGKDSMACLHLLRDSLDCAIYVDTGYAYPETLELVEYTKKILPVHIVYSKKPDSIASDVVPADWTHLGHLCTSPKKAIIQNYHECCFQYIGQPLLEKAIALGVNELVYGQRNDESRKSTSRNGDVVFGIKRIHPIEGWSAAEVMAYLGMKMEIPKHYIIKHSSLDCWDCTAYKNDSVDRVEWMRNEHPDLYEKYAERRMILDGAIKEAING